MATTRETMLAAYRMFAVWRRDILAAGFSASGAPLVAYRRLDSALFHGGDTVAALRAAETALSEWSASDSAVRETCGPVLAAVRAETEGV